MDIEKHITELKEDGLTTIPDVYTSEQCREYVSRFESIAARFAKENRPLDPTCQVIENPFRHDSNLVDLIYHDVLEGIFTKLLDEDYVLINANIINRRLRPDLPNGGINIGMDWHTDSRYVGGQRLEHGFGYIVATMFNDFSADNGSTMYIPKTHIRRDRPERQGNYEHLNFEGKVGSMVIFDSGLWHRGGPATNNDRWSMFSYYGPWFVKPYFRFPEMLGKDFGEKLSKPLRRLFHYYSTPPLNEDERRNTVIKG